VKVIYLYSFSDSEMAASTSGINLETVVLGTRYMYSRIENKYPVA
jgi:hypothetical protein